MQALLDHLARPGAAPPSDKWVGIVSALGLGVLVASDLISLFSR